MIALRKECIELRDIVRGYKEVEQRVSLSSDERVPQALRLCPRACTHWQPEHLNITHHW